VDLTEIIREVRGLDQSGLGEGQVAGSYKGKGKGKGKGKVHPRTGHEGPEGE
jgi:hypothetical protein